MKFFGKILEKEHLQQINHQLIEKHLKHVVDHQALQLHIFVKRKNNYVFQNFLFLFLNKITIKRRKTDKSDAV